MNPKKVIVCDLDRTLTLSKSPLSKDMAEVLCHVLARHFLAVISGASYKQFQYQFVSQLRCPPQLLENLSLFPQSGSLCYVFDTKNVGWKKIYEEKLSSKDRKSIIEAFNQAVGEAGLDLSDSYGEVIEDRGSQVTFSGRGQEAPLEVKEVWDRDQTKRRKLMAILDKKLPQFNFHIGGISSIDVTRKGVDKAYAIGKIKELLHVADDDIIYVGDALYKGGNDEIIKTTGIDFIQEDGPNETIEFLSRYM